MCIKTVIIWNQCGFFFSGEMNTSPIGTSCCFSLLVGGVTDTAFPSQSKLKTDKSDNLPRESCPAI